MYTVNTETLILDLLTLSITPESVEFESRVFPPVSRSPVQKLHCSRSVPGGCGQEDGASPLPQFPVQGCCFSPPGGQVPAYLTCPSPGLQRLCSQWVQSVRLRLPSPPWLLVWRLCSSHVWQAENAVSPVLASVPTLEQGMSLRSGPLYLPATPEQWHRSSVQREM